MGPMAWKLLAAAAAAVGTAVADKGVRKAWVRTTGKEPPADPMNPDVEWREAVAWALLSGAAIGIARLVMQRRAAAFYRDSNSPLARALNRTRES